MARCVVVQHAAPETPGRIGDALLGAGVELDVRCVHEGDALPDGLGDATGLVVMGGPMSAHLDDGFPSRRRELALLAEALASGVPTLGICLGAQLLALASGGEVFPGAEGPEIGWGPVRLEPAAAVDPLLHGLPEELPVLHWHGDTFRPGIRTVLLASTARYPAQAFRAGASAWGLQFHVEVDEAHVAAFVEAFPADAARAEGGAEAMLRATPGALSRLEPLAAQVLGRFARLVAGG